MKYEKYLAMLIVFGASSICAADLEVKKEEPYLVAVVYRTSMFKPGADKRCKLLFFEQNFTPSDARGMRLSYQIMDDKGKVVGFQKLYGYVYSDGSVQRVRNLHHGMDSGREITRLPLVKGALAMYRRKKE
jgi:hypothetical protein